MPLRQILYKIFPFLVWGKAITRTTLKSDILAGLTGAVIVLPQGVAFALIAGLPPEYGLYTAIITPVIAALFGSSWHLVSGPTTAISIVVFATLSDYVEPGSPEFVQMAFTLAFLAGIIQLALGIARMGTLVNFVSNTVVIGFTAGAAVLIISSQITHILGVAIPRGESFLHSWANIFSYVPDTNLYSFGVAMATLACALLIKRFLPKWPNMLLAMILGSLVAMAMKAAKHGVAFIGEIPSQLPPISSPDLSYKTLTTLAPDAFAVALLGLITAVSIAKSISSQTYQRIDGNQEFIGQGLSNIVGSFFSSYPASASFTRSGLNHQSGAKTPMASIFAAIFLALIVLFTASLTAYLPMPVMGGIILIVGYNLIDFAHIRDIFKTSKSETAILAVTFFSTLFLDLEFAIYVGVILSLIFYLQKTSQPKVVSIVPDAHSPNRTLVEASPTQQECPHLKVVRIDGSLFFGAVDHVQGIFQELVKPGQNHLLILGRSINFIDIAGGEWLVQEADKLKAKGGGLYIQGLKKTPLTLMEKGGYLTEIGADHFFESKDAAIRAIYQQFGPSICKDCTAKIYTECIEIQNISI